MEEVKLVKDYAQVTGEADLLVKIEMLFKFIE